jgi:GH25 family lysozyme M1 (1,4-beta-N-acetylmuramidase)
MTEQEAVGRIIGIDVARWQGIMPWADVAAAGIQWAWIKCAHGSGGCDPKFKDNWKASKGILPRGAYLWFTDADPLKQADFIISKLDETGDRGECPIAVDFEEPETVFRGGVLLDRVRTCLARIHAVTGRAPYLYTGTWYWVQYAMNLDAQDLVETYPLWLAQYPRITLANNRACGTNPPVLPKPSPPKPWADRGLQPVAWQFDGNGGCMLPNGVDADFNEYLGEDFAAFCGCSTSVDMPPETLRANG